jgi:hypothetical protein
MKCELPSAYRVPLKMSLVTLPVKSVFAAQAKVQRLTQGSEKKRLAGRGNRPAQPLAAAPTDSIFAKIDQPR